MNTTFYLFTSNIHTIEDAIAVSELLEDKSFEKLEFIKDPPFESRVFLQKNRITTPDWVSFISDHVKIDKIRNISNSLVIFIRVNKRIFAITKGYGSSALKRKGFEKSFGLRVVLNAIDPQKIRLVDTRQLDIVTKQTRTFLNQNSPLFEFGIDIDTDLISLVSGLPRDGALARKLIGADSLTLSSRIEFSELGEKCKTLLDTYNQDTYKKEFRFIDYLRIVTSEELVKTLDTILYEAFWNHSPNLFLAYPKMVEEPTRTVKYKIEIGKGKKSTRSYKLVDDVEISEVYDFLSGIPKPKDLSTISIFGVDENQSPSTKGIYDLTEFFVFETDYQDHRYLYQLNKWYEISTDYFKEVSDYLHQRIDEIKPGYLPPILSNEHEKIYNKRIGKNVDGFVNFDRNDYPAGGYDKIEVCDLLSSIGEFICIKKYNKSSTLSHLFKQGTVSASCLVGIPNYRQFIRDRSSPEINKLIFDLKGELKDRKVITYVFAIAFRPEQANRLVVDRLPFFSKISLKEAARTLYDLGFSVKVLNIPVADA